MCDDSDPPCEPWGPGDGTEGSQEESIWGEAPWCCQDLALCLPPESCLCPGWLHSPCASQAPSRAGPGPRGGPRTRKPWGRDPLQWGVPPSLGVCDTEATCSWAWRNPEAARGHSRTLCHPSFQPLFTAVSGCSRPSGPAPPGGPVSSWAPETGLLLMDPSSCFYADPTLTPGHRIYNWLSRSSREALRRLQLNAPAPIMAVSEVPSPPHARRRRLWLSEQELSAILALLELPAAENRIRRPATEILGGSCTPQGQP